MQKKKANSGFSGRRSPEWQNKIAGGRNEHPAYTQRRCTAKSKRSQQRCSNWACRGSDKCRMHSGKNQLKGWAQPMAKTGKYSKYIAGSLRERYEESIANEDIANLSSELGLLDARASEILEKLGTGETSELWQSLNKTWLEFMMAVRVGDSETQNKLLGVLNRMITQGHSSSAQWEELFHVIEKRRKVSETENKRLATSRDMISVEQAVLMINMLIEATRQSTLRHADKKTAQAILVDAQQTYTQLVGPGRDSRPSDAIVDGEYSAR